MKKNTSYILTFLLGALFGSFALFNFWQPNLRSLPRKETAQIRVKRFQKDFDARAIKKRQRRKAHSKNAGDQIDKDLDDLKGQMDQVFRNSGTFFKLMEDSIRKTGIDTMGVSVGEITEKITKDSVILEMDITNIDNSTLKIDVQNNEVLITGEARIEKKSHSNSMRANSVVVSSFSRSYPVPRKTIASRLRIEYKDENTMQIIFPKIKK